jgi:hypothetical protein
MTAKNWTYNLEGLVNVEGRRLSNLRNVHVQVSWPERSGVFCQVGATVRSRTA